MRVRAGDEDPLVHQSPEHWSVTIPKGWAKYPDEVLKALEALMAQHMEGLQTVYEAEYAPADQAYFTHPLVAVRSLPAQRGEGARVLAKLAADPLAYWNDGVISEQTAELQRKGKELTGFGVEFGKFLRLERGDGTIAVTASEDAEQGKFKSMIVSIYGNQKIAQIAFSSLPFAVAGT